MGQVDTGETDQTQVKEGRQLQGEEKNSIFR